MLSLNNEYVVVLDACVLAPMPLCDTLLRLAEEPAFFIPKWSTSILDEVGRTLSRFGYRADQVERRLGVMRNHFEEALVEGYECLVNSMTNEAGDRHVLAVAVRAGAYAIVSDNKKHFPDSALKPYEIECLTSDEFLLHQYHLDSDLMLDKLAQQAAACRIRLADLLAYYVDIAPNFLAQILQSAPDLH